MKSVGYKYIELILIYVIAPVSFALDYSAPIKLGIGLVGFIYIILVLFRVENVRFKIHPTINWIHFCKQTILKLIIIILITTAFLWQTNKDDLFIVLLNKPKLWLIILFVYSIFSVYPQELLYRTFFFKRYSKLCNNKFLLVFVNALLFALAHIFFKNTLVLMLTFFGGILFALTFIKTQSTLLVSIEHAIYGCWLFTLGLGEMLGFPS